MADARSWRPTSLRTFGRGLYRMGQNALVYGTSAGIYDRVKRYVGGGSAIVRHTYEQYPWLSRTSGRRRRGGRMRYRNNPPRFYGRGYGRH